MRLYLSSFGLGDHADELLGLLRGKKRAAVILNAKDGSSDESRRRSLEHEIEALERLGLEPSELDLRNYYGHPGVHERLAACDLVWLRGGNVFTLRDALRRSGADDLLAQLLEKDAIVYGGFSAAVCVLGPSLRGYETVDAPSDKPIWDGLGVLPYAVAPHYQSDHPESASVERLVQRFVDDRTLFRVLRDGEVILVDGPRQEVLTGTAE